MNVMEANRQWSDRPADERFENTKDMLDAALEKKAASRVAKVVNKDLRFTSLGDEVVAVGHSGRPATMTDYAFGYESRDVGAPAAYLRTLPANIAASALDHSHRTNRYSNDNRHLLFHTKADGGLLLRGASSSKFTRVWDSELVQAMRRLEEAGWVVPPAWPSANSAGQSRKATEADVGALQGWGTKVQVGDTIAPAGLYMGDRDVFGFLVDPTKRIDGGHGATLMRGVMLSGSEVAGEARQELSSFLLNCVCGNHNLLGARDWVDFKFRHVGDLRSKFASAMAQVETWRNRTAADEEATIRALQLLVLGKSVDEVVEALSKRIKNLPKGTVEAAVKVSEAHPEERGYASPFSAWGVAQGLTRVAQDTQFAGKRQEVDALAGKVLSLAF